MEKENFIERNLETILGLNVGVFIVLTLFHLVTGDWTSAVDKAFIAMLFMIILKYRRLTNDALNGWKESTKVSNEASELLEKAVNIIKKYIDKAN